MIIKDVVFDFSWNTLKKKRKNTRTNARDSLLN